MVQAEPTGTNNAQVGHGSTRRHDVLWLERLTGAARRREVRHVRGRGAMDEVSAPAAVRGVDRLGPDGGAWPVLALCERPYIPLRKAAVKGQENRRQQEQDQGRQYASFARGARRV